MAKSKYMTMAALAEAASITTKEVQERFLALGWVKSAQEEVEGKVKTVFETTLKGETAGGRTFHGGKFGTYTQWDRSCLRELHILNPQTKEIFALREELEALKAYVYGKKVV